MVWDEQKRARDAHFLPQCACFYDALRDIDRYFTDARTDAGALLFAPLSLSRAMCEKENDVFNNVVKGLIPTG